MKGLISLDIDGTTAVPNEPIALEVANFLKELAHDQWHIMFVTGRTKHWAHQVLKELTFPYFLSVQNGAITLDMPTERILSKKYLDKSIIPIMQEICYGEPTDFVIYAGFEFDDLCYYRPDHFSNELLSYLESRSNSFMEKWQPITSFDTLGLECFPSVKCFGLHAPALEIAARIEKRLDLHVPLIRDPFNENYYVAQATHPNVNKGQAVKDLSAILLNKGLIIAAGDDYNDLSMLTVADVKIVMATAPPDILANADIIAPSAVNHGIIAGLKEAIHGHHRI